jgi:hypothetical protein
MTRPLSASVLVQRRARFSIMLFTLLGASLLTAPALAQLSVPPELHDWEGWVLHGHENHRCPWLFPGQPADEQRVCAWPGALELSADAHGAHFNQRWELQTEDWLALPGDSEFWPEAVTLDGKPAALVAHQGLPMLRAPAGAHVVAGSFRWTHRPEVLAVPDGIGLVSLSVDGVHVSTVARARGGVVLGAQSSGRQDNSLDLRVFRLLDDDLPGMLVTEIHLAVAGEAREVRLPQALPPGFVPTGIDGELTARLDPYNTLRVQVRPGEYSITIEARGPSPLAEVRLGTRPAPWPAQEVWSFKSEDRLRVASVEGVSATDPVQANVPQEWQSLPAYRMSAESALRVVERSRGLAAADANQLQLARVEWLDFSGRGYTIVDRITGRMRQGWRLDLAEPYQLQSVRRGANEFLLVTNGPHPATTGVEVRDQQLALQAVSRLAHSGGARSATGWDERFMQVSGRLIVAPGFRLIAAIGPDSAPQAWLERWGLLDLFAVLLIATVTWRLFGVRLAAIAIAAIALTHQEADAPTWLWLNFLVALALLRAAPDGRLKSWAGRYRLLALALLLLALLPFAIAQVRMAIYPALEVVATPQHFDMNPENATFGGRVAASPAADSLVEPRRLVEAKIASGLSTDSSRAEEVIVTAARQVVPLGYEPGAPLQAGPGLPDWRYHSYEYSWSGPVDAKASTRFLISPPWLTRLWRLLGIALSVFLLIELTRGSRLPGWLRWRASASALAALALALVGSGSGSPAQAASTPDQHVLAELQTRLLAPPKCTPDCAAILAAHVTAGARLTVVLDVSSLDAVAVALPGADPAWTPDTVQVDGAAAGWVIRKAGTRYVNVPTGSHVVRLEGSLEGIEGVALGFPLRPQSIEVSADGWDSSGVTTHRLVSGALQLTRRHSAGATGATTRQEEFPPYVSVARVFRLGRQWTIETSVHRIAPRSSAFSVRLPVLAQEAVTTAGLEVTQGTVLVGLAAGEAEARFSSVIPIAEQLELTASADAPYVESWHFSVGPTWHADFAGVPPVAPEEAAAAWRFEYYPRPGEHLQVHVTRPSAISGSSVAFDRVKLSVAAGKRSSDGVLALNYRSTQGGRQSLKLPQAARVTSVQSDGQELGLRPEHGELSLAALPGAHMWSIYWQEETGAGLLTRSPAVALSAPASNVTLSLRLPADRWVLCAFGAGVGPTILYWGELILFVIVALLIGRSALTPLATKEWLLLGLGLSTFSWGVFALFVLFVALFEWRARQGAAAEPRRFNLVQIALALLAVTAVAAVVAAVPRGLLAHPDMRIVGTGPEGELSWFIDQAHEQLPRVGVLSVALWWYKLAMLAWALWLSFALTRWIRWAWSVWSRDGLWRATKKPAPPPAPAPASPPV